MKAHAMTWARVSDLFAAIYEGFGLATHGKGMVLEFNAVAAAIRGAGGCTKLIMRTGQGRDKARVTQAASVFPPWRASPSRRFDAMRWTSRVRLFVSPRSSPVPRRTCFC